MTTQSPIEQALIDGVLYWDKIGPNWHRLLHRTSQDVFGHYRLDYGWKPRWTACIQPPDSLFDQLKEFVTPEEARQWIETAAASRLGSSDATRTS